MVFNNKQIQMSTAEIEKVFNALEDFAVKEYKQSEGLKEDLQTAEQKYNVFLEYLKAKKENWLLEKIYTNTSLVSFLYKQIGDYVLHPECLVPYKYIGATTN